MIDLKAVLTEYATAKEFKIKELDNGKFSIDVILKLKAGSARYQFVWVWIAEGRAKGKDCVYITSRVGIYTPNVNVYQLLKESGYGVYSTITIVPDKDKEGKPCESIFIQASPILEYLEEEELIEILMEVAEIADILEEKHFGGDSN
ncbi:MAG: hypothetical protein AB8E82_01755 [Aureispira sp.]